MGKISDDLSAAAADPEIGIAHVAREVRQFLKKAKQKRIGTSPRKRQVVPRAWTLSAWRRQNYACHRCFEPIENKNEAHGDHFIPIIQGGAHERDNIVALHKSCNSQKGGRDIMDDIKRTGQTILERLPILEKSDV